MLPTIVHGSSNKRKLQHRSQFSPAAKQTSVDDLETQLYRAVQYFLLLSEIFVSLPYDAHQHIPTDNNNKHSIWLILHIVWCIIIYASLIVAIYSEFTKINIYLPTIHKPLYFGEYLIYILHIFLIITSSYWSRHKCRRLLHNIAEFDYTLVNFERLPNYERLTYFLKAHVALVIFFVFWTASLNYFYSNGIFLNYIRSLVVYLLPNLILSISLIQYYTLLYAIAQRSRRLNEILLAKLSQKNSPGFLNERLQRIRLLYSALQVFTKDVNNSFAFSVVLVYIGSFTNLAVNIFLIYKYVDEWNTSALPAVFYSLVWTIMHIAKMLLILYYNQSIQNQNSNTIFIMNEIGGQNTEMEDTVTHFVLQLIINTRTNVVCGVAELNLKFITTLLTAMSTVFIFLLQYDITYEALKLTHNSGSP
ncbi:putative gustatory receptor 59f [Bactrocera neohumeralis]|uniref:putative gustatory receptor 59f n=1 Tax=Bactrocera tryoni TaxID=59916 RepID=UPI001A95CA29|nr:putative gustatory receptor 59f [Bactrocera tryoni]XP_050326183.1 putative gustatory receptor 59f [Bactrocera neohumeralis]